MQLSSSAQAMTTYLQTHGASFLDDIAGGAGLLKAQAEDGLSELVAAGVVSSDSFNGLRALLVPMERKRRMAVYRRYVAQFGLETAGRWSLVRRHAVELQPAHIEQVALVLLRRYGVVFRRLLEREAEWLPPWYQLLRAYRRLEAQGQIRGGRFVSGFAGEQYALPDAVGALRAARRKPPDERFISISAADPLNLVGILTPGPRVPAFASNRILWRDGMPIAVHAGGQTQFLTTLDPPTEWNARNVLINRQIKTPASLTAQ